MDRTRVDRRGTLRGGKKGRPQQHKPQFLSVLLSIQTTAFTRLKKKRRRKKDGKEGRKGG